MRRFLFALTLSAVALTLSADAQACGPVRANIQARRETRQSQCGMSAPVTSSCQAPARVAGPTIMPAGYFAPEVGRVSSEPVRKRAGVVVGGCPGGACPAQGSGSPLK